MKIRMFPKIPAAAVLLLLATAAVAEPINIRMSREDRFRLQPPQGAQLKLEKCPTASRSPKSPARNSSIRCS